MLQDTYDELAEFALGWLGWSEEQTLYCDINAIVIAQRGHMRRLTLTHGDPKKVDEDERARLQAKTWLRALPRQQGGPPPFGGAGQAKALTPDAFDKMFGGAKPAKRGKAVRIASPATSGAGKWKNLG